MWLVVTILGSPDLDQEVFITLWKRYLIRKLSKETFVPLCGESGHWRSQGNWKEDTGQILHQRAEVPGRERQGTWWGGVTGDGGEASDPASGVTSVPHNGLVSIRVSSHLGCAETLWRQACLLHPHWQQPACHLWLFSSRDTILCPHILLSNNLTYPHVDNIQQHINVDAQSRQPYYLKY